MSNGEFIPASATARDRAIARETLEIVDRAARRNGIDRRRFLLGAGGLAASLAMFDMACSADHKPGASGFDAASTTGSSSPAGSFSAPPPEDVPACEQVLNTQGEFIFDVHTHHVMPDAPWRENAPETVQLVLGMLPPDCASDDQLECVNRAAYLHDVFLASDTTVALLSDVPNSGPDDAPVPFPDAVGTQQLAASLTTGGASRVLVHNVIAPNVGDLSARLDGMTATASGGHVAAFKVYTAWSPTGHGFGLDDPAIGLPVVQHAHDLGVKVLCAHKGLPLVNFDAAHNGPEDIVAVSRLFPDMQFVVFHGAWDADRREGPYNPAARLGIDTLLAALDRHQVPPNDNVWADLGTVWRQLMTRPTEAAHAIGKLLSRVGTERVLWGTDAVWYGSPQPQIAGFRAFQISAEAQERYGYPPLTDELKRKVFGLNAANLFGIDPAATRCAFESDPLTASQGDAAGLREGGALGSPWRARGPMSRREMFAWLSSPTTHWSPY
ncbi:MAG TPA: amidohydrolase family protein [Acidimicrobiales bacterium]|nr:amidohydrolase family protein [Acidimicrobiales bacterium]